MKSKSDMDNMWNRYVDVTPRHNTRLKSTLQYEGVFGVFNMPRKARITDSLERALLAFSPSERLLLYILSGILAISTLLLVGEVNSLVSVNVPTTGGSLVEGEVGPARFINPLLALSQPDQDLTALVYSGLMRSLPDGTFVPDLAESYTISHDGRVYTFTLRPDATFHDGVKVTSADIMFTIQRALDPVIGSSHRADWTGVQVDAPDERTVVFTLPHAYAPFFENTTLGILPKHLWETVSAEEFPFSTMNTHPVGSGPYRITKVSNDSTGAASKYELSAFSHYALGKPYLSHITFKFYNDEDALINALNKGQIDSIAALPPDLLGRITRKDLNLVEAPLPRVFGIFFNQSKNPVLAEKAVRNALEVALDKASLVENVMRGRAQVLQGPAPSHTLNNSDPATPQPLDTSTTTMPVVQHLDEAKQILSKAGWVYAEEASTTPGHWSKDKKILSIVLATADQPELVASAKQITATWRALGVQVSLQIYPLSELNINVIRPRNYEAILFGEIVGPELDLYAFWHSSQRNDPGLNLAMYANPKTDALLTKARATTDRKARIQLYEQFSSILIEDHPAIFLYAPDFLYVVPQSVHGLQLGSLATPSDRFENVYNWYTETEHIWKVFASNRY